jgi:hypothetical protein
MNHQSDEDFIAALTAHLATSSEGRKPIVPLIKNADGSINREKTLALPCYQNLTEIACPPK